MLISVCGTCVWFTCACVCVRTRTQYIQVCVCTVHTCMYVYIHATYPNFTDVVNSVQKWIIEFRIIASEMTCMHMVRCVYA